jgi:glycosyltransferase involved in cell wall biosynthesis
VTDIRTYANKSMFGSDDDPPNKEGRASEHPLGVAYHGPWERDGDGFNEHVRRSARALASTGCPVHLRSVKPQISGTPQELPSLLRPLLQASLSCYSVQIHQIVLSGAMLSNIVAPRHGMSSLEAKDVNARRVLYSVWERTSLDDVEARALNQFGQVWTACQANAEMLRVSGVSPRKIHVFPIPYFPDDPLIQMRNRVRKPGVPRFYHIGKWEPRKGQDQILRAFMRAFKPGEAHLILKTMTLRQPIQDYTQGPVEEVDKIIKTDPVVQKNGWENELLGRSDAGWSQSIEIVTRFLAPADMMKLHEFGDIYVSLSRGEGFDMPAFDARLAGNLMVYTPSGGQPDFAGSSDEQVPLTGTVPCHPFYGWHAAARYFDFDVDAAVLAMRAAAARVQRGRVWPDYVDTSFTAKEVGARMLKALKSLCGEVY